MSVLTPDVCDSLQDCFCSLAVNGTVAYQDIPQLFRMVGFQLDRRETTNMLQQIMLNKQGNLEFLDFITYLTYLSKMRCSRPQLLDAFRSMDREGTGRLHVNELRQIYTNGLKNKKLEQEFDQLVKSLNLLNN